MKITIDTKEDSHEEIRRAILMLSKLVGGSGDSPVYSNEASKPEQTFHNIFDDGGPMPDVTGSASAEPEPESDSIPPDPIAPSPPQPGGGGIFNMFGNPAPSSEKSDEENPGPDEPEPAAEEPDKKPEITIIDY